MPTLLLKLLSQPLLVLFMQPCTTLWDCHLAQSSLPGTCYLVFLVSLISYNFVTSTNKRSLVITFVARTIVVATSIILSVTTFLNYSRWISATQNLDSRPTDCIALNKYMRTVHSLFIVDPELSIASIFAVSGLLTLGDTLSLSYLPPRSLSFNFVRFHSSRTVPSSPLSIENGRHPEDGDDEAGTSRISTANY